ncbi:MAG: ABC transporter permease [Candidatus Kryptoniota bacterium]
MKVKPYYHLVKIASRQLLNRKRQTGLTLLGISVGVMVLISAVSLMDGLLQSFIQKIVDIAPHIIVSGEKISPVVPDTLISYSPRRIVNFIKNTDRQDEDIIKNYARVSQMIERDSLVTVISPVVSLNAIATFGTLTQPVQLFGIKPAVEDRIEKFSQNMINGSFQALEKTPDGILLGTTVASNLTAEVGDHLEIASSTGSIYNLRIVGIFSTGINDIDDNCYVNLRLAQNLAGYNPGEVDYLYLRVSNLPKDAMIANEIKDQTNYKAITWEEKAANFVSLFKMISGIVYFLVFFVMLVAGLGVANVLITNVLEKYRDIAILKSIGFKKSDITLIYLLQGLIVAVIGAIVGDVLGYVMIQVLGSIPVTASQSGPIRSDRLLMGKSVWYFILTSAFAMLVSAIASVTPARNAASLNPVDILRGER